MREEVVPLLRCPVCRAGLSRDGKTLTCAAGHRYDIARQGYVTLLSGRAPAGDTAAMVAAREAFLTAGHYHWLADLIASRATDLIASGATDPPRRAAASPVVVDAGAGTGYYLAHLLRQVPAALGIALDSSGYALRRAVRAHPRIGAVRTDLWRTVPVVDGVADLVVNVFAPRNGPEFRRILRPGGRLLTVTPTRRHLAELVDRLDLLSVDEAKHQRLAAVLGGDFTVLTDEEHEVTMRLEHASLADLVRMGPSAWHTDPDQLATRIAALPEPFTVTAGVRLSLWRPH